jgi:hypothetical protein
MTDGLDGDFQMIIKVQKAKANDMKRRGLKQGFSG